MMLWKDCIFNKSENKDKNTCFFFLIWKIYEILIFLDNLLDVTFYYLMNNLCSLKQVYKYYTNLG